MSRFNSHFKPPNETEIALDNSLSDNQAIFVFDFANTQITAERLGYQFDFEGFAERFPNISKYLFLTQRDLVTYGRELKSYQTYASRGKNCDVEITLFLNSLTENKELKQIFFFSGDGDFHPVLVLLKKKGIAIKCLSYETSFSPRLLEVAEFVPIGQDFLQPLANRR